MQSASYADPKFAPPKGARIAYVIAGYFFGKCKKQYPKYTEDKLATNRFNLACHKHYQPGLLYDLVYVDNGSDNEEGIAFMQENGKYLRRENEGFSFGAWVHAWEQLANKYDYFLFTEDDHVPCKDGWLLDILQAFNSDPAIGAVGNVIETRGRNSPVEVAFFTKANNPRDIMHNLDGGWTFTSSHVLRDVAQYGGIQSDPKTYNSTNEVCFQTPILESGYKILGMAGDGSYFVHGTSYEDPSYLEDTSIERITPLINCNARFFHPKLRDHFAWYEG